jgi:hypothetical protein
MYATGKEDNDSKYYPTVHSLRIAGALKWKRCTHNELGSITHSCHKFLKLADKKRAKQIPNHNI